MLTKYLIAFGGKPMPEFLDSLRVIAASDGIDIKAAKCVPGPGCSNLAILIEENERFINMLTMALMPAQWTTTNDDMPEGTFVMEGFES
jgi:hypothetical protein